MRGAAAIFGAVAAVLGVSHPDVDQIAWMEGPARLAGKLPTAIVAPVVRPLPTVTAPDALMHPHTCPVVDRGFNALYARASAKHGVDGCEIHALAEAESNQNPDAVSPAGAAGIAQFMPATAEEWGVDRFDAASSIDGASRYLAWLADRFPHWSHEERELAALSGYNWGIGNVRKTGCTTYDCLEPHLPKETRDYVRRILHLQETGEWI